MNWFHNLATKTLQAFYLLIFFLIFISNLFFTTYFNIAPSWIAEERVIFEINQFTHWISFFILFTLIFSSLFLLLKKIKVKKYLFYSVIILLFIFGVYWICVTESIPATDSRSVLNNAIASIKLSQQNLTYISMYPYQLGFQFYAEIIFRIFGTSNYFVLRLLNLIYILLTYIFIHKSSMLIIKNENITYFCSYLFLFFIQPILLSTYIYGIIPGLCFSTIAVYFTLRFIKTHFFCDALLILIFTIIAVIMKPNSLIVFIAILITLFLHFIKIRKSKYLSILLIFGLTIALIQPFLNLLHDSKSTEIRKQAVPKIAWLVEGFSDSPRAPGWYNGSHFTIYEDCNSDLKCVNTKVMKKLNEKFIHFASNPRYTLTFFTKKLVSTWSEPTFQSLQTPLSETDLSQLDNTLLYQLAQTENHIKYIQYCQYLMSYIFTFAFIGLVIAIKKYPNLNIFSLIIVGSALYYLLFETKSRYIISVVPYIFIYTSIGFNYFISKFNEIYLKYSNKHRKPKKL